MMYMYMQSKKGVWSDIEHLLWDSQAVTIVLVWLNGDLQIAAWHILEHAINNKLTPNH